MPSRHYHWCARLDESRVVMLNSGFGQLHSGRRKHSGRNLPLERRRGQRAKCDLQWRPLLRSTRSTSLGIPDSLPCIPGREENIAFLRWTAPASGEIAVSADFAGIAKHTTTDVHVLHQGKSLFDGFINVEGSGNLAECKRTVCCEGRRRD